MSTDKYTLSCLRIQVVLNFCWKTQQTRQVAPASCSAERGQRGAGQMAPSTIFFSLVPLPQLVWLELLSQQCALSSVKVMVHVSEGKRELLMAPAQITQANQRPGTDNQNQRTCEWLNHLFPFLLDSPSLATNTTVVFYHLHQPRLT